jgi:hypothetical protein
MAVDDEAIGLVRDHRWLNAKAQAKRLKEAGCSKIFDLDVQDRADMEKIAGRRVTCLVYAFLLANPDRTRGMLADLTGVLERIKARGGTVVDLDSRLDSETNPAAFKAVVADQVRRHNQGEGSNSRKGKPGRKLVVFTPGQLRQARAIWKDVENFPTYDAAKHELRKIKGDGGFFSETRAFRMWRRRPKPKKK